MSFFYWITIFWALIVLIYIVGSIAQKLGAV